MNRFLVLTIITILATACSDSTYTPKPHGYPRIDFPEKVYEQFAPDCDYQFQTPVYSKVVPDSSRDTEPCWYNVHYKPFNATLHLSYKKVNNDMKVLDTLINDSYSLVFKHTIKAEDIVENYISKPEHNKHGIVFDLSGNTATALNFHLTDSSEHFVRGALYFNQKTEVDSIAPVLDFLRADVLKLIETLSWKQEAVISSFE